CGWPQPRMTSSTSLGSRPGTLAIAWRIAWAARSSGRVALNEPRTDLASGVRELATMTASLMAVTSLRGILEPGGLGRKLPDARPKPRPGPPGSGRAVI